jgi:hypothetical protein
MIQISTPLQIGQTGNRVHRSIFFTDLSAFLLLFLFTIRGSDMRLDTEPDDDDDEDDNIFSVVEDVVVDDDSSSATDEVDIKARTRGVAVVI